MRGFSPVYQCLALGLSLSVAFIGAPLTVVHAQDPAPEEAAGTEVLDPTELPEAGDATAAIIPLAITGELSDADRASLTSELVEGLQRGAFGVVPPDQVASASADAVQCADADCFVGVATATGATHVVKAKVEIVDRDYDVHVQLIDGASGAVMATSQEGCEICSIADAGSLVASAAATLRTKLDALAKGPSTLNVVSEPVDAVVTIDGEIVGTTPLDRPVIPGKHVIRVTKEGYISIEREVTLVEGVQESISFELEKVPSRLPKRPWGIASLVVGVVGLGAGIGLTVMHDRQYKVSDKCTGANVDARGQCKFLWDTKWYGVSAAIVGAALTTLGVAILLNTAGKRPKKDKGTKKKAQARVGIGPGSVLLEGRF